MHAVQFLLLHLIEECAEVQQRATKALRFGLDEVQPGQDLNNLQRLSGELNDLFAVVDLLQQIEGGNHLVSDEDHQDAKFQKILQFACYSVEQGTLDILGFEDIRAAITEIGPEDGE